MARAIALASTTRRLREGRTINLTYFVAKGGKTRESAYYYDNNSYTLKIRTRMIITTIFFPSLSSLPNGHNTYITPGVSATLSCADPVAQRTQIDALRQSVGQFVRLSARATGQSQPNSVEQRRRRRRRRWCRFPPGIRHALVLLPADPA